MESPLLRVGSEGSWVISEYHIASRRRTQEVRRRIWRKLVRRLALECPRSIRLFAADGRLAEPPEW